MLERCCEAVTRGCKSGRYYLSILAFSGFLAAGCTGSEVTGGGVPLGGTRAVSSGQVVQSTNSALVVAGASVTLQASDGTAYLTTTDADGNYSFPSVPVGPGTLTVEPPPGAHLRPERLPVKIEEDGAEEVLASLDPETGAGSVTSLTISPASIQAHPGDQVALKATLTGSEIPEGAQPSYVITGGVGKIIRDDIFVARHAGTGTITAIYDGQTVQVPVTVQ